MILSFSHGEITTESPLSIGKTLSSSNGVYELGFFSLNNSQNQYVGIWFKGITPPVVVWVANREKPVTDSKANLSISSNGTLLLLDRNHGAVWSSGGTFASNSSRAELSDSGNLIVIDNVSGRTLWESFAHLSDTMLPFSPLTCDLTTGEKRVLTSWKSYTDPSPGDFVTQITPQVPSQVLTTRGSKPYYRSGPWAKTRFTGIPLMNETLASEFSYPQDANGSVSFSFVGRDSKLPRLVLTPEGRLKRFQRSGTKWEVTYEGPANSCDFYGLCGPFGLCVRSVPPKCKCFKGFVPKYKEEWERGNWTEGCVRRTELLCYGNSTGKSQNVFHHVANIKPPDFYKFANLDAEECYQSCLQNCSCLAFAFIREIGCLMWNHELMDTVQFSSGGELLSIRLARSELEIISNDASQDAWSNDLTPQDFSSLCFFEMNTIQTATNNFSLSNKLGHGGFGSVYKGKLQDGKEIAVKRLSSSSRQGKEEFMNEIVLISKLQHRNLVRILGCCIDGEERLLIYEFMVNKSLDTFLFDSSKKHKIDWQKRFDIIQGIARGLLYLHHDSRLRVIHRDLKVSNILLDENMNPKISDFGLARMFEGTQCEENTRRVVGTLGYMSPEYAWTGIFSEKSDIYAFGVLLLEIISGEKISRFNYAKEGKDLLEYVWGSWCENGGIFLLDKDVDDSSHPLEVARCVQIGLLCVQHQPVDRPNTLELMSMLTTKSDLPSPEKPIFVVHKRDYESLSNPLITFNEMTQSVIIGR
uniref:Receptor-like serine/threonine-protein kinase n=1 Tax=Brassica campestris TaxID=3711 RepID=M4EE76_BRACM